jgi:hypothetical protein
VEVFPGNTPDTATFASQLRKVARRFGGGAVTLVGDRGMIKGPQIELLAGQEGEFHSITAMTKPQMETLLARGVVQVELFDEELAEVTDTRQGVRYVLRRNPLRAAQVAATREDKRRTIEKAIGEQNNDLAERPRAQLEQAADRVSRKIDKLRLSAWLSVSHADRSLSLVCDADVLAEVSKLDGCDWLKTDLEPNAATKELVHDRYKGLAEVEWAFRTSKTAPLEVRPIFVRKAVADTGPRAGGDVGLPHRDGASQVLARSERHGR